MNEKNQFALMRELVDAIGPDACIGVFDFLGDCQLWLSILKMYSCTGLTENSVFRFFKQCDESLSARL